MVAYFFIEFVCKSKINFLWSKISSQCDFNWNFFTVYFKAHIFDSVQHFFNSNSNNMVDFTTLMSWPLLLTTCNNLRTFKVIKKEINREICQNCQPNKLAWSKKDQISLSGFCSTTHVLHIPIQVAGQYWSFQNDLFSLVSDVH